VNRSKLNTESLGVRDTQTGQESTPTVVVHIFGSIMMPTCKALQVSSSKGQRQITVEKTNL